MHMKIDMSLGKCNQVFRRGIFILCYILGTNSYHYIVSYAIQKLNNIIFKGDETQFILNF